MHFSFRNVIGDALCANACAAMVACAAMILPLASALKIKRTHSASSLKQYPYSSPFKNKKSTSHAQ
jgi:hypothetical protein